jgi:ribosomal protein L15E
VVVLESIDETLKYYIFITISKKRPIIRSLKKTPVILKIESKNSANSRPLLANKRKGVGSYGKSSQ